MLLVFVFLHMHDRNPLVTCLLLSQACPFLLVPRCSSKLTSQEIEKKTLTNSFSARPFIMFLLWLCGFLNSNPDRPFSYFICTANFPSCLYSLLGLQNLQSQHREDTSDYSSKRRTKEINFCEYHLCINFLCSRSRRLHKFWATCTDNWSNIQRHQTAVGVRVSLLLSKITEPRYRNYNLYIQSEGSWTPKLR